MKIISKHQVLMLHKNLIEETGGVDGVRDDTLLDSALSAPFQTYEGHDLYPTVLEKGVRLGYGLIKNHAFIDGNKRIGTHTMLAFLDLNRIKISFTQEELSTTILDIASGEKTITICSLGFAHI